MVKFILKRFLNPIVMCKIVNTISYLNYRYLFSYVLVYKPLGYSIPTNT